MDHLDLAPIRRVRGTIRLPGSKSLSNRILLLAALSSGTTRILDLLESDDTRYMIEALRKLGFEVTADQSAVVVTGMGGTIPARSAELFLGNAGTAFRPLTAVLAFAGGEYKLSGLPRMHERPIGDLVDALRQLGARIDYLGNEGYPPLAIHPPERSPSAAGARATIRGDVSSQFLSALLMAAPLLNEPVRIDVIGELISQPYVKITLNMMERFGVSVRQDDGLGFDVQRGSQYVSPQTIHVEGDASSASYFLTAGVVSGLTGGGPVRVVGVGESSIQGDVKLTDVLELMGGQFTKGDNWIEASAHPSVVATGKLRRLQNVDLNHIPDAAMVLAVAALFADGPSELLNIGSWRVKETDRIAAMATELKKLGATVEEGPDFLKVRPPQALRADAVIDTYEDHRIAMSFSLAALGGVPVRINDPNCVAKTFPEYFKVLDSIVDKSTVA